MTHQNEILEELCSSFHGNLLITALLTDELGYLELASKYWNNIITIRSEMFILSERIQITEHSEFYQQPLMTNRPYKPMVFDSCQL